MATEPTSATRKEGFWKRLLRVTLPLLVWIAHFAFSYGLAAAQCSPAGMRAGGPDRLLLGGATLAAVLACAWLTWRAWRVLHRRRHGNGATLGELAGFCLAGLALIAVAWGGIPVLLLSGCA